MLLQNLKTASPSRKTTSGFTLVEMLVVIVVIGLLAAIAVPIFLSQSDKASDAALKSDLSNAARMLSIAEASGVTLPSSLPAGQVTNLGAAGTITPAFTLTVSGTGATLCVEGTSGSGDVWSADLANGLRNFDCAGNANGQNPLVLSYATTSFTTGSNNQVLAPTVAGGSGTKTYSVSGSLPAGVTFDEATGTFTGPADSAWNFTATQISAGGTHTCAVTTAGGAKCWGSNSQGRLGDGTGTPHEIRSTPVDVVGLTSGVTSISAGDNFACAVVNGGAKCWGQNTGLFGSGGGQLGNGSDTNDSSFSPVDVVGLTSGVASISAGRYHACAVLDTGGVKCWGYNGSGQLGNGTTSHTNINSTPVDVRTSSSDVSPLTNITQISAGWDSTCAVTNDGGAKCWGSGTNGALGDASSSLRAAPVDVFGLTSGVASISAGEIHACAVTTSGGAKCWGWNQFGQLGDGTTTNSNIPVDVFGLTSGVTDISAGPRYTCAVVNGGAKCWGPNSNGRLGTGVKGSGADSITPVDVIELTGATAIDTGNSHVCALTSVGAKCWGRAAGQLGNGIISFDSGGQPTPVAVVGGVPAGFPTTVDVTVTDATGSTTESVTLTVG